MFVQLRVLCLHYDTSRVYIHWCLLSMVLLVVVKECLELLSLTFCLLRSVLLPLPVQRDVPRALCW